jgi:hypothetical protein
VGVHAVHEDSVGLGRQCACTYQRKQ